MATPNLDVLRRTLAGMPDGWILAEDQTRIINLLAAAWPELEGGGVERMAAAKLRGRTEDLTWQPPYLSFIIKRHGGAMMGSTRAEIQRWEVDVQTGEAVLVDASRFSQLRPRAQPVHVDPLAAEVVHAIEHHKEHPALEWHSATRVRVIARRVEQLNARFKQTAEDRRKRFINALTAQLEVLGWSRIPVHGRFILERREQSPDS